LKLEIKTINSCLQCLLREYIKREVEPFSHRLLWNQSPCPLLAVSQNAGIRKLLHWLYFLIDFYKIRFIFCYRRSRPLMVSRENAGHFCIGFTRTLPPEMPRYRRRWIGYQWIGYQWVRYQWVRYQWVDLFTGTIFLMNRSLVHLHLYIYIFIRLILLHKVNKVVFKSSRMHKGSPSLPGGTDPTPKAHKNTSLWLLIIITDTMCFVFLNLSFVVGSFYFVVILIFCKIYFR